MLQSVTLACRWFCVYIIDLLVPSVRPSVPLAIEPRANKTICYFIFILVRFDIMHKLLFPLFVFHSIKPQWDCIRIEHKGDDEDEEKKATWPTWIDVISSQKAIIIRTILALPVFEEVKRMPFHANRFRTAKVSCSLRITASLRAKVDYFVFNFQIE